MFPYFSSVFARIFTSSSRCLHASKPSKLARLGIYPFIFSWVFGINVTAIGNTLLQFFMPLIVFSGTGLPLRFSAFNNVYD